MDVEALLKLGKKIGIAPRITGTGQLLLYSTGSGNSERVCPSSESRRYTHVQSVQLI